MSKVSTYLNFSNHTEEAFTFYKTVFKTEFTGQGLVRFGDFHQEGGCSPNPGLKHLVMHVELPTIGGHTLMGSDSPEAMGFTLHTGNTIHINLQPDTRTETERLFEALGQDGQRTMPLADTAWGAYFGMCIDKFGVSWMFNCIEQ